MHQEASLRREPKEGSNDASALADLEGRKRFVQILAALLLDENRFHLLNTVVLADDKPKVSVLDNHKPRLLETSGFPGAPIKGLLQLLQANPPRPPASKRVDAQTKTTGLLPVN